MSNLFETPEGSLWVICTASLPEQVFGKGRRRVKVVSRFSLSRIPASAPIRQAKTSCRGGENHVKSRLGVLGVGEIVENNLGE